MDGDTFDALVKKLTQARVTRLEALRGLLASAAVGLTGATRADETAATKKGKKGRGKGKGKGKDKRTGKDAAPKVTLCHKPGTADEATISVAQPAVQAHLAHGDCLGTCPCPGPTTTTTTSTTTTTAAPTTTTAACVPGGGGCTDSAQCCGNLLCSIIYFVNSGTCQTCLSFLDKCDPQVGGCCAGLDCQQNPIDPNPDFICLLL